MSNVLFDSDPSLNSLAREAAQAAIEAGTRALDNEYEVVEGELDFESIDPEDAIPSAMVMDRLAADAANAKTDGEAFAFLAPLAKLAIQSVVPKAISFFANRRGGMPPGAAAAIQTAQPAMTAAYQGAAQVMRRRGRGQLLIVLGRVARRAASEIATRFGNGENLNGNQILRIISKHIGQELSNPQRAQKDMRAATIVNQRFRNALSAA
jgi:hypothetical protein